MAKIILFILLLSVLSYFAGSIAKEKNRDFWKVFWLSIFTSPIVGILIAFFLKNLKHCIFCDERIKPKAIICKHCNKEQPKPDIINTGSKHNDKDNNMDNTN